MSETLWFVSGSEEVQQLLSEGIRRGRIWSADELRRICQEPGLTHEEVVGIARARQVFNAEILEVIPAESEVPPIDLPNEPAAAEPVQQSLDLDAPFSREFD